MRRCRRPAIRRYRGRVQSANATVELDANPGRHYDLPADGTPSLLFVFGPEVKLGARAYSSDGRSFAPGTTHREVRLDFWADDKWTDVVRPGASFVVWYGGDVGGASSRRFAR